MMITDTPISVFRSAQSTEPATTRLGLFLDSKKWRDRVLNVRAVSDKKERDQLKKALPAATISGVFHRRAAAAIEQYNGLVCMDFDAGDNPGKTPAEMRATLREFDEVAYAGLSVSGQGVFAVIATNNTDPAAHAAVVDLLGSVLAQFDLFYDRACKDVCRLRFVSYDPEAYWNATPAQFDAAGLLKATPADDPGRRPRPVIMPRHTDAGSTTEKKVQKYLDAIEAGSIDITANYEDWMRLGMALANEFGSGGESYFQRLSQYHPKYDPREVEKKFNDFVKNTSRVHIGTFFKICNDHNIRL